MNVNDNAIVGYIKTIWDKYKIIIFIIFARVIVSFIELAIATNVSECVYTLHSNKINILQPACLRLQKDDCVYVFKSSEFNKQTAIEKAHIPNDYLFKNINEHIATQITKPIRSIKQTFENFNNSSTPFNDITSNIMSIAKIQNLANPYNAFNTLSSKWLIYYPYYLKPKCFINKTNGITKIYFN